MYGNHLLKRNKDLLSNYLRPLLSFINLAGIKYTNYGPIVVYNIEISVLQDIRSFEE